MLSQWASVRANFRRNANIISFRRLCNEVPSGQKEIILPKYLLVMLNKKVKQENGTLVEVKTLNLTPYRMYLKGMLVLTHLL